MVTPATTIFYPETDGMPLPDGDLSTQTLRRNHFRPQALLRFRVKDVLPYQAIISSTIVEGNPQTPTYPPICFVLIGGNVDSLWENDRYLMWEVGKAPDFVMEIGSPSTARQDLGPKRDLYASLGVGEYWTFDPSGGDHYGFELQGETLAGGEYREVGDVSRRGRRSMGLQPHAEPGTALAGRPSALLRPGWRPLAGEHTGDGRGAGDRRGARRYRRGVR